MIVVFLGAPGAGKGTQAAKVVEHFHLEHVASGNLLREALSRETGLGKEAKVYMDKGDLVPDEIVLGMIQEKIASSSESKGLLFDGYPRTIDQAKSLDKILDALGKKVDIVLQIEVDQEELVKRMLGRGRTDDNQETIQRRFEVYYQRTKPVIDYYSDQEKLSEVDGRDSVDQVWGLIHNKLEAAI